MSEIKEHTGKQSGNYGKKMIAPIIVTVLVVLYFVFYFSVLIFLIDILWIRIALLVFPVALSAVMIYVCVERMKEIRSGEEDDLSQY